ncbi:MAG: translation elongation factor Ts, partial [Clostridia bacterium]|nr:translation elongation factor Ts [Clostridia bacterium]
SDFVAKNDLFVDYVKKVAEVVATQNPADLDALYACEYPGEGKNVLEVQNDKVLVIGENIKVRRFARYAEGETVAYVHMGGRIGVLVNMEVSENLKGNAAVIELGKDVAMQIAALNPTFLDKSDISEEFVQKEMAIRLAQAKEDPKNTNKPDAIIEKIVMGGLNKYYKEICLLQQAFVKDDKVSVEQHVAAVAKSLGGTITVKAYTRFEKGEGIEKKQENYAEEIAKLANM